MVTQNRECLFGEIVDDEMVLNDAGQMIEKWYFELENKFPDIQGDEYVVMPNHFHAIIINLGADLCVRPENQQGEPIVGADLCVRPENQRGGRNVGADLRVRPENQQGEHNVGVDLCVRPHNQWGEDKEGRHAGLPLQKNGGSFETVNGMNRGEGEEGRHAGLPLQKNGESFKTVITVGADLRVRPENHRETKT